MWMLTEEHNFIISPQIRQTWLYLPGSCTMKLTQNASGCDASVIDGTFANDGQMVVSYL